MGRGKRPISAGEASQRLGGPSFICHILQPYLILLSLTRASVIRAFLFLTQAKVIPLSGPCLGLCQECSYPPGSLVPFKSRLKSHFFVGASSSPSCVGLPWSFSWASWSIFMTLLSPLCNNLYVLGFCAPLQLEWKIRGMGALSILLAHSFSTLRTKIGTK